MTNASDHPPTPHWCQELYEAHAPQLLLYGRALGLSHSESEDVLQETFVALLAITTAPLEAHRYCLRAFRNRALNHRRTLWRRVAREFEAHRWFEREPGEDARERAAMACLARLPPEQRETIVLKIWHELTFEAIGELLDLSPHTVAGRYRYGLQKLRLCLTRNHYELSELTRSPGTGAALLDAAQAVTENPG